MVGGPVRRGPALRLPKFRPRAKAKQASWVEKRLRAVKTLSGGLHDRMQFSNRTVLGFKGI